MTAELIPPIPDQRAEAADLSRRYRLMRGDCTDAAVSLQRALRAMDRGLWETAREYAEAAAGMLQAAGWGRA